MHVLRRGGQWSLDTPAKLNLHLEVLARRADGYHDLETLMVPISLHDSISFEPVPASGTTPGDIVVDCEWATGYRAAATTLGELPPGNDNLVARAARLVQQSAAITHGAKIRVVKRIPSAAGLGGASSDAAATLKLACAAWNVAASRRRLLDWAAELGSDVPFFIDLMPAICRGRGERIESVGRLPAWPVVVIRPPIGLSTPEVFRHCRPSERPLPAAAVVDALRRGDSRELPLRMRNALQAPAAQRTFWIERLSQAFAHTDVLAHAMTGSGSCYFGVCRNHRHARRIAGQLRSRRLGTVYEAEFISG